MRWQQMKRLFAALAWRRASDEKIPLSEKNCVANNGAISEVPLPKQSTLQKAGPQEAKMTSVKAAGPDACSAGSEPMSPLRKFAMFVSLNIIAFYFAAFAWVIPCRTLDCQAGREWILDLHNISISTNLEVSAAPSSTLLFGYLHSSEDSRGVTALGSSSGSAKWEVPLEYSPVHCSCNVVDVNGDGVADCLIFGESHLLALNASNGHVFWIQEFNAISTLVATIGGCDDSVWIVLVEDPGFFSDRVSQQQQRGKVSMVFLDSRNATLITRLPLHCDSFPKQLVTWRSKTNVTQLAFQCSYMDRTEVQMISEEALCDLLRGRTSPKGGDFSLLYRYGSSTAVDDVLLLPVDRLGLVVGWSTMVAMATDAGNPPRLLWQTTSGSIRLAIKFLVGGYFTSRNSTQMAIVIQDGFSSLIKVVDVTDGKEVASVDLGGGAVSSIRPVFRTSKNNDSLLIIKEGEVSSPNRTASDVIGFTTENASVTNRAHVPDEVKSYWLLTFGNENNLTELLAENKSSEIAVRNGDCSAIFLAIRISNQATRISSRDLKGFGPESSCSCR